VQNTINKCYNNNTIHNNTVLKKQKNKDITTVSYLDDWNLLSAKFTNNRNSFVRYYHRLIVQ